MTRWISQAWPRGATPLHSPQLAIIAANLLARAAHERWGCKRSMQKALGHAVAIVRVIPLALEAAELPAAVPGRGAWESAGAVRPTGRRTAVVRVVEESGDLKDAHALADHGAGACAPRRDSRAGWRVDVQPACTLAAGSLPGRHLQRPRVAHAHVGGVRPTVDTVAILHAPRVFGWAVFTQRAYDASRVQHNSTTAVAAADAVVEDTFVSEHGVPHELHSRLRDGRHGPHVEHDRDREHGDSRGGRGGG
jgi:hypothetical protein